MLNATWRRIGYVALAVILFGIGYGIGYVIGEMDAAKFLVEKAVDLGMFNDIGKAELMEYWIKMKGGGC